MRPENAGPFAGDTFTTHPFAMKAINYILEPHRPVAADQTTPEATP